jgi:hypothetical protein
VILEALGHLVPLPQPGELRAGLLQRPHEFPGPGLRAHRPVGGAQVRHLGAALPVPVVLGVAQPFGRDGEPAVDLAASQPRVLGFIPEQRFRHPVLHQRLAQVGQDQRRGVVEPVEHPQQRRGDVGRGRHPGRGTPPGHPEQVVPLVAGQPQRPGQRGQHLLARLRAALLLQAGVVVRGHRRQRGDLLAAQSPGPAPRPGGQPDVLGPQLLPAMPQEASQCRTIHAGYGIRRPQREPGIADPPITALCPRRPRPPRLEP